MAHQLATEHPEVTALLMADNQAVPGLMAGLQTVGIQVPRDVSVLGLLNSAEIAASCNPTLTLIASAGPELGRLGVETLLRRLHGEPASEPVLRCGPLVVGESTGPVRSD